MEAWSPQMCRVHYRTAHLLGIVLFSQTCPPEDMGLHYTEVRANAPLHQVTCTGKYTGVWLCHTHLSDGVITLKDDIWFLGSKLSPSFLHSWALTAEAVWLILQLLTFEQETSERNVSSLGTKGVSFQIQNSQNIKCSVNDEGSFKIQSVAMKGAANTLIKLFSHYHSSAFLWSKCFCKTYLEIASVLKVASFTILPVTLGGEGKETQVPGNFAWWQEAKMHHW